MTFLPLWTVHSSCEPQQASPSLSCFYWVFYNQHMISVSAFANSETYASCLDYGHHDAKEVWRQSLKPAFLQSLTQTALTIIVTESLGSWMTLVSWSFLGPLALLNTVLHQNLQRPALAGEPSHCISCAPGTRRSRYWEAQGKMLRDSDPEEQCWPDKGHPNVSLTS